MGKFGNLNIYHLAFSILAAAYLLSNFIAFFDSAFLSRGSGRGEYLLSYYVRDWLTKVAHALVCFLIFIFAKSQRLVLTTRIDFFSVFGALLILLSHIYNRDFSHYAITSFFFVLWFGRVRSERDAWSSEFFDGRVLQIFLLAVFLPILALLFLHIFLYFGLILDHDFLVDGRQNIGLFRGESFRGFFWDRTNYAYFCGLIFIYIFFCFERSVFTIGVLLSLLFFIAFAGSRAVILACVVSLLFAFLQLRDEKKIFLGLLVVFFLPWFSSIISFRGDFLGDPGERLEILRSAIEGLQRDPFVLIFGYGGFAFTRLVEGGYLDSPHNFLLNSVFNFGIFVTFLWVRFLWRVFVSLSSVGRSAFLFPLTVGFFHNSFDAYYFSTEQLMGFLLAFMVNARSSRCISSGGGR